MLAWSPRNAGAKVPDTTLDRVNLYLAGEDPAAARRLAIIDQA